MTMRQLVTDKILDFSHVELDWGNGFAGAAKKLAKDQADLARKLSTYSDSQLLEELIDLIREEAIQENL